jgi:predicted secreted protein
MRDKILRNVCGNENPEKLREKIVKVIAKETHLEKENSLIENTET